MRVMIEGFPHRAGVHCASAATRDVLEHQGCKLSEELVFGLGCGLNFLYSRSEENGYHYILGRGDDIEGDTAHYLGAEIQKLQIIDAQITLDWIRRYVGLGVPAIINLEASRLPYVLKRYTILDGVGYGGHRVVSAGYDDERDEIYLWDYGWTRPQAVTLGDFKTALLADRRSSTHGLWVLLRLAGQPIDLRAALLDAMRANVHHMVNPWIGHTGLRGLRRFIREVTGWPRTFTPEYHRQTCRLAYVMLETGGTGGGNFRRVYARFLQKAAAITGIAELTRVAMAYYALARHWSQLAALIRDGADGIGGLYADPAQAHRLLEAIGTGEVAAIHHLGELVGYVGAEGA